MAGEKLSFQELINSSTPVLVDFYADWCGPCKMMSPIIEQLATEMGDKMKVIKIDVDKNAQLSDKYQIRGIPTFMLFQNGKILWQQAGAMSGSQLKSMLQKHVK